MAGSADIAVYYCPVSAVASHQLLYQAAAAYLGKDISHIQLAREPGGKPYFPGSSLHFSISHSGKWWLCAFARERLGLDIQQHQPCNKEQLSSRFFHPLEDAFLRHNAYEEFYRLWAAKESWLKYTGQGITGGMDNFSVVDCQGNFPVISGQDARLQPVEWPEDDYSVCLCARRIDNIILRQFI